MGVIKVPWVSAYTVPFEVSCDNSRRVKTPFSFATFFSQSRISRGDAKRCIKPSYHVVLHHLDIDIKDLCLGLLTATENATLSEVLSYE